MLPVPFMLPLSLLSGGNSLARPESTRRIVGIDYKKKM
jgi:hypothetical protein